MQLGNTQITFEETDERMKVMYPIQRNMLVTAIYTALVIAWLVGLIAFIYLLFNPEAPLGINQLPGTLSIAWFIGVVLWLYIWTRYIGRIILRQWQFHLSTRELLFIDKETLMIRRPVSIFGNTDAYDRRHISPFYMNEKYDCLGFQYGNVRHVIFGLTLPEDARNALISFLNTRYFPNLDEDEDDELD